MSENEYSPATYLVESEAESEGDEVGNDAQRKDPGPPRKKRATIGLREVVNERRSELDAVASTVSGGQVRDREAS